MCKTVWKMRNCQRAVCVIALVGWATTSLIFLTLSQSRFQEENCILQSKRQASTLSSQEQHLNTIKRKFANLQQKFQQVTAELVQKQRILDQMRKHGKEGDSRSTKLNSRVNPTNTLNNLLKTIYAITPTYARYTQKADLTRLSQTFRHIRNFHWILVEDSNSKTSLVTGFLERSRLTYTHLAVATPEKMKLKENEPRWRKARGVEQRNLAIEWLVKQHATSEGVVYFADDDNTYDLRIFEQMRSTRRVSVWPVGLTGGLRFEGPICSNNKVTDWHTAWHPERPFPLDMAGFAVNLKELVKNPAARIDPNAARGYLESSLLQRILKRREAEPLANDCTEVLVWHTRTEAPKMKDEIRLQRMGKPSDPRIET
ncbi:galactosylgalactosylxylosylprotein 3-beta-glucuronosyltransferase 3-like isoform X2 [Corticium candelabrum]|uniref:galactosylgalactosylxylosylprotein 3-beta-glucuronosyltransferase 3-like isoform X2 n=1 Tax=Corticium candelabrum TaxID=121492 RepID=UPI002E273B21|nr:galactosylgalactosylxylosylprotein 3-beta-glucuronosyltransferase 3-like isoform X2 [Corticium candelabrum]